MNTKTIFALLIEGRKVLFRCHDHRQRKDEMHDLYVECGCFGVLKFYPQSHQVQHIGSGGFVHFIIDDHEADGMEYDQGAGAPLTPKMRTRIRP